MKQEYLDYRLDKREKYKEKCIKLSDNWIEKLSRWDIEKRIVKKVCCKTPSEYTFCILEVLGR